jgi:RNA polymerase sigma-32 factor
MVSAGPAARHAISSRESPARGDALRAYLRDVQRHEVLDGDAQTALAREYARTRDPRIGARLVETNQRLVMKLAREIKKTDLSLLDLVQEGNLGLLHALEKFDADKDVRLSTYAAWWIRAFMLRAVMRNARLVRLGTSQTQRRLFFGLRREIAKLEASGLDVTPEALAQRLGVTPEEVVDMRDRLSMPETSLDAPLHDDGSATLVDAVVANHTDLDDILAENERRDLLLAQLRAFAETLRGRDRFIFERRLVAEQPLTLREIGAELGVSRERARQLEKAIEMRLVKFVRAAVPPDVLALRAADHPPLPSGRRGRSSRRPPSPPFRTSWPLEPPATLPSRPRTTPAGRTQASRPRTGLTLATPR